MMSDKLNTSSACYKSEKEGILRGLKDGTLHTVTKDINEDQNNKTNKSHRPKSCAWDTFGNVVDSDGRRTGYVQCTACLTLLKHESHKTGTSNLIRHRCSLAKKNTQNYLCIKLRKERKHKLSSVKVSDPVHSFDAEFIQGSNGSQKSLPLKLGKVPPEVKNDIAKCLVKFAASDLRPLKLVQGKLFQEMAQGFVDIGATIGRVSVAKLMPSHATMSKTISEVSETLKAQLITELSAQTYLTVTIDLWQGENCEVSFLTVMIHYVTELFFELKCCTLGTREMHNSEISPDKVKEIVFEILTSFGCEPQSKQLIFVVKDNTASSLVTALQDFWCLNSFGHALNTNMKHLLESLSNTEAAEILRKAHQIFEHNEFTGVQIENAGSSSSALSNLSENSDVDYLKKTTKGLSEVCSAIGSDSSASRMAEKELMSNLLRILEAFKEATDQLSQELQPTLPFVFPWYKKLLNICTSIETDHLAIVEFKWKALEMISQKLGVDMLHKLATVLDPRMKSLKMISDEHEKKFVYLTLEAMLDDISNGPKNLNSKMKQASKIIPTPKTGVLDEFFDTAVGESTSSELEQYLEAKISFVPGSDALQWWRDNGQQYPTLSILAQKVLAVPASVSNCGRIPRMSELKQEFMGDDSDSLSADMWRDMVFLNNNLK